MSKAKNIIIAVLLVIIIWFSAVIIRLENFHYATTVGFCADVSVAERAKCLEEKETRTNPLWPLFYALTE